MSPGNGTAPWYGVCTSENGGGDTNVAMDGMFFYLSAMARGTWECVQARARKTVHTDSAGSEAWSEFSVSCLIPYKTILHALQAEQRSIARPDE